MKLITVRIFYGIYIKCLQTIPLSKARKYFNVSFSGVSIYTEIFSTSNYPIVGQASKNPSGVKFTIGMNSSTPANHILIIITLARLMYHSTCPCGVPVSVFVWFTSY